MLIAVNYHYIRPSFDHLYPGIQGIRPSQFEAQLKMLSGAGTFVSAGQIHEAIVTGNALPRKSIVVTFDDGLLEQFEQALPILDSLHIPAIFFINTAAVRYHSVLPVHKTHLLRASLSPEAFQELVGRHAADRGIVLDLKSRSEEAQFHYNYDSPDAARLKYWLNFQLNSDERQELIEGMFAEMFLGREEEISRQLYMSGDQIAQLGTRGFIGSHSHEHLPLGLLSDESAEHQIQLAQTYLRELAGYAPYALSYPFGSRDACCERVGSIAAKQGIDFAFTMERAANPDLCQPFQLARFDCNDLPGGKSPRWSLNNLFETLPLSNWYR